MLQLLYLYYTNDLACVLYLHAKEKTSRRLVGQFAFNFSNVQQSELLGPVPPGTSPTVGDFSVVLVSLASV